MVPSRYSWPPPHWEPGLFSVKSAEFEGRFYPLSYSGLYPWLNYLVSYYKKNLARGVLPYPFTQDSVKHFFKQYPNFNNIIIFPSFTPQQVIETVKSNVLFPTGITRYIVKGRVLNIDVPLSLFNDKKSLKEQNEMFDKYILQKKYRIYEEATISFE